MYKIIDEVGQVYTQYTYTKEADFERMIVANAKPKEIYIGMHCDPNHAQRLKEIGDSWGIPVYRMAFDECNEKYELVASRVMT